MHLLAAAGCAGILSLAILLPGGAKAADLTASDCAGDRDAYLAQAAENRAKRVAELTAAADATDDDGLRRRFIEEREQAWVLEEERRGQAFGIYRECMAHVERLRGG